MKKSENKNRKKIGKQNEKKPNGKQNGKQIFLFEIKVSGAWSSRKLHSQM